MAKANITFSIVEQYFEEEIYPNLLTVHGETLNILKEKFVREASFDPAMVRRIENYYGVRIW